MNIKATYFLSACLFFSGILPLAAQTDKVKGATQTPVASKDSVTEVLLDGQFAPDMIDTLQNLDRQEKQNTQIVRITRGGSLLESDDLFYHPKFSKHFLHKRVFDRFFLEVGGGYGAAIYNKMLNTEGFRVKQNISQPLVHAAFGDWIRPEHGVRLGFGMANNSTKTPYATLGDESRRFSFSADYLLNLTAVAQKGLTYEKPKSLEAYAIFGVDGLMSKDGNGHKVWGWGAHTGLRAQYHFMPNVYAFVEPRLNYYSNDYLTNNHSYVTGSVLAGIGMRMLPKQQTDSLWNGHRLNFFQDTFMSVMLGANSIIPKVGSFGDYAGTRFSFSVGKWVHSTSAIRINTFGTVNNSPGNLQHNWAWGVGADYIWSISNTYYGFNDNRKVDVNLFGGPFYYTSNASNSFTTGHTWDHKRKRNAGFDVGMQFNFRVNHFTDFIIEPRLDITPDDYNQVAHTSKNWDVMPGVMMGFAFYQGPNYPVNILRNRDFKNMHWYDHVFFEAAGGLTFPLSARSMNNGGIYKYFSGKGFGAIGKWFSATSGMRLYAEAGGVTDNNHVLKVGSAGLEYIWNITNALVGYDPTHKLEVIGAAGVNVAARNAIYDHEQVGAHIGGNASLQFRWNALKNIALFAEPQVRFYKHNFMNLGNEFNPDAALKSERHKHPDILSSFLLGVQLKTDGYDPAASRPLFEEKDKRAFYSVAIGAAAPLNTAQTASYWYPTMRFSYGQWHSPVAGWRGSIEAWISSREVSKDRYMKFGIGADYLIDLSALSKGYSNTRRFQLNTVTGANFSLKHTTQGAAFNPDIHGGLQAVLHTGKNIDFYFEPLLAYEFHEEKFRRLDHFMPTAFVGMTYNTVPVVLENNDYKKVDWFLQDGFFEFSGGFSFMPYPGYLIGRAMDTKGFRTHFAYGKWFDAYSALRLGIFLQKLGQGNYKDLYATGLNADYILNLSNFFQGYNGNRWGWLSVVGGLNLTVSDQYEHKRNLIYGFGFGPRIDFRVMKNTSLFIEPRFDFYSSDFSTKASLDKFDRVVSIMAGMNFNEGRYDKNLRDERNASFESKAWNDHLFIEGAFGATSILSNPTIRNLGKVYGLGGQISMGKTFTAVHGARLAWSMWSPREVTDYKTTATHRFQVMDFDLAYMWNMTNTFRGYIPNRKFEVYGIGGFDLAMRSDNFKPYAGGMAAVQGRLNINNVYGFFLEPQLRLHKSDLVQGSEMKAVPRAAVLVGFHMNSPVYAKNLPQDEFSRPKWFAQDGFFETGMGFSFMPTASPMKVGDTRGFRVALAAGKWFNPYSGARIGAYGQKLNQGEHFKTTHAFGITADYMLNFSNLFTGYVANRWGWVSLLAGGSATVADSYEGKRHGVLGFGFGPRFDIRIMRNTSLFIEPRVDFYASKFAAHANDDELDRVISLMAGFNFTQGRSMTKELRNERNADFHNYAWYDNLYFEGGFGVGAHLSNPNLRNMSHARGWNGQFSMGKNFSANHGMRLDYYASSIHELYDYDIMLYLPVRVMDIDVNYVWNMSNTFRGFKANRKLEMLTIAGLDFAFRSDLNDIVKKHRKAIGSFTALQGRVNVNRAVSFFLEPQLRIHKGSFIEGGQMSIDPRASVLIGMHVNAADYNPADNKKLFDESSHNWFLTFYGGATAPARNVTQGERYGTNFNLGFGHWYSGVSAWRVSMQTSHINEYSLIHRDFNRLAVNGDYIMDVTAMTYGVNEDRVVSLRALAGLGMGTSWFNKSYFDNKLKFQPDFHFGGQFVLRPSKAFEIFVEPQLAYQFMSGDGEHRLYRLFPSAMLGVSYRMGAVQEDFKVCDAPAKDKFVSGAFGLGATSATNGVYNKATGSKITYNVDVTIGKWFNGVSGIRFGIDESNFAFTAKNRENMAGIHLDYMLNIVALSKGADAFNKHCTFSVYTGLLAKMASRTRTSGSNYRFGMGAEVGMQLGYRIKDNIEIFIEPNAQVMSKRLSQAKPYAIEGQGKCFIGTKYCF